MALTKHQKLARGMKRLCDALDVHFQKVASVIALQFHFFEKPSPTECSLMSEKTLGAMIQTHLCGMELFSSNAELRLAAKHSPLVACVLYLQSKTLVPPLNVANDKKSIIPWGVRTVLPTENLQKLEEAKLEALLYCSSEVEMSEWIDWFENEDKATSLTNRQLKKEKKDAT